MAHRVCRDCVALGDHAVEEAGVPVDEVTDDEEGRPHTLVPQDVEKCGRVPIWPVIEGQGNEPRRRVWVPCKVLRDDPGRRSPRYD